jgi:hypothetical protein
MRYINWLITFVKRATKNLYTRSYMLLFFYVWEVVKAITSTQLYIALLKFLHLSYLMWLDSLLIDFLQKKSLQNWIKNLCLISPDIVENFFFKVISNPLIQRIINLYRSFKYKEVSSAYSLFLSYYLILALIIFFIIVVNIFFLQCT